VNFNNSKYGRILAIIFRCCLVVILALNFAGVYYWLDIESLWIDELFTAYFADPMQTTISQVFRRSLEDVHPPVYYLITWMTTRLTGIEFTIAARGQSALFSILALVIVYRSFPAYVNAFARLFSLAAAATSFSWFNFAVDARSYGLVFIIGALFALVGLRIFYSINRHNIRFSSLCMIVVLGLLGSLIHYYLLLLAGGVVGMLLLCSRDWYQRGALVLTGLAILIPVAVFIKWHAGYIVLDVENTWFSVELAFLKSSISAGFAMMFGTPLHRILMIGIFAGSIFAYLLSTKTKQPDNEVVKTYLFVIGCFLAPIILGLVISIIYVPVFSERVFTVVMPFYWVLVGMVTHSLFARLPNKLAVGAKTMSILALLIVSVTRFYEHGLPSKENWRDSAAAIEKMDRCKGEIIPVVGFAEPVTTVDNIYYTYGYYLANRKQSDWLKLPSVSQFSHLIHTPYPELVQTRMSDEKRCPVLLWSVHHLEKPHIEMIVAGIVKQHQPPKGRSIIIREWDRHTFIVMLQE